MAAGAGVGILLHVFGKYDDCEGLVLVQKGFRIFRCVKDVLHLHRWRRIDFLRHLQTVLGVVQVDDGHRYFASDVISQKDREHHRGQYRYHEANLLIRHALAGK